MSQHRKTVDRRKFFQGTVTAAGATALAATGISARAGSDDSDREKPAPAGTRSRADRLPREVWIATITQHDLTADTPRAMIQQVLRRMKEVAAYEPDIICLPEVFPTSNLSGKRISKRDAAETPIGEFSGPFAEFARNHNCYVVCPILTRHEDRIYNSAVFLDRSGKVLGEYHKVHPTRGEMKSGVTPGPLDPPVFHTDFGVVGAQICFDIEWTESWRKLRCAGAEIVFWPSAFAGGLMVNTKAWENKYCVVSSTRKDTSKICDVTGETIAATSRWNRWVCAPINLEKAFLHTWPYVRRFGDILAKYGRDIVIRNFPEEEWTIIESRSPDVKIAQIMEEFELKTHEEHIAAADEEQCRCR